MRNHSIRFRKDLEDPIPEVTPRIEARILHGTLLSLLEEFRPANWDEFPECRLEAEYYFATQGNLLLHRAQCMRNRQSEYVVSGPWTAEKFRGLHIAPAVLVYMMRRLKSENVKELYYSAAGWNPASQRCALRAGFQVEKVNSEYYAFGQKLQPRNWFRSLWGKDSV